MSLSWLRHRGWSRAAAALGLVAALLTGSLTAAGTAQAAPAGPRFAFLYVTHTHGAWNVDRTRTFTLTALAEHRPQYVDASPYPRRPSGRDDYFVADGRSHGHRRWELQVRMTSSLRVHRYWNVGVRTGHTEHSIKIRALPANDHRGLPVPPVGSTHHG